MADDSTWEGTVVGKGNIEAIDKRRNKITATGLDKANSAEIYAL